MRPRYPKALTRRRETLVGYQTNFGQYRDRYKNIRFEREDGILTMYLHSGGDSLVWDANIHDEMGECLRLVGADRENKVIVLTGIGENFCGEIDASSRSEEHTYELQYLMRI